MIVIFVCGFGCLGLGFGCGLLVVCCVYYLSVGGFVVLSYRVLVGWVYSFVCFTVVVVSVLTLRVLCVNSVVTVVVFGFRVVGLITWVLLCWVLI